MKSGFHDILDSYPNLLYKIFLEFFKYGEFEKSSSMSWFLNIFSSKNAYLLYKTLQIKIKFSSVSLHKCTQTLSIKIPFEMSKILIER